MDSELEKQFDEHRKRLKGITKLAYDQFGDSKLNLNAHYFLIPLF